MRYPLVHVVWVDSFGCSPAWEVINEPDPQPLRCHSVGFLVAKNDHCTLIVPHLHEADEDMSASESGCGDMAIPNVAIVSMKTLVEGDQ